jgi:hypothetical protein
MNCSECINSTIIDADAKWKICHECCLGKECYECDECRDCKSYKINFMNRAGQTCISNVCPMQKNGTCHAAKGTFINCLGREMRCQCGEVIKWSNDAKRFICKACRDKKMKSVGAFGTLTSEYCSQHCKHSEEECPILKEFDTCPAFDFAKYLSRQLANHGKSAKKQKSEKII